MLNYSTFCLIRSRLDRKNTLKPKAKSGWWWNRCHTNIFGTPCREPINSQSFYLRHGQLKSFIEKYKAISIYITPTQSNSKSSKSVNVPVWAQNNCYYFYQESPERLGTILWKGFMTKDLQKVEPASLHCCDIWSWSPVCRSGGWSSIYKPRRAGKYEVITPSIWENALVTEFLRVRKLAPQNYSPLPFIGGSVSQLRARHFIPISRLPSLFAEKCGVYKLGAVTVETEVTPKWVVGPQQRGIKLPQWTCIFLRGHIPSRPVQDVWGQKQ